MLREVKSAALSLDYFLISNNLEGKKNETISQLLKHCSRPPKNVHIFEKQNICFDLGSIGWLLAKDITILEKYRYYIWVNSSVLGPVLAPYAGIHWTQPLLRKLNSVVKLVGPSINCGVPGANKSANPYPHVQSFVSATDREGMKILYERGVFNCHKTKIQAIQNGEIMASRIFMEMNFSIASLMANQDTQWSSRKLDTTFCNSFQDPMQTAYQMGGVPLQLDEVLFVKVKQGLMLPSSLTAVALSTWKSKAISCLRGLFMDLTSAIRLL